MEEKKIRIVPDDGDRLMSLDEVQARLKTSVHVLKRLLDQELLMPVYFGRRRYVRKYTLNRFLAKLDGKDIETLLQEPDRCKQA